MIPSILTVARLARDRLGALAAAWREVSPTGRNSLFTLFMLNLFHRHRLRS